MRYAYQAYMVLQYIELARFFVGRIRRSRRIRHERRALCQQSDVSIRSECLRSCTTYVPARYRYTPRHPRYSWPPARSPVVWALPARHKRLSNRLSTPPVRLTFFVTSRGRAQTHNAVRTDFFGFRANRWLTFVVVFFRLLLTVL